MPSGGMVDAILEVVRRKCGGSSPPGHQMQVTVVVVHHGDNAERPSARRWWLTEYSRSFSCRGDRRRHRIAGSRQCARPKKPTAAKSRRMNAASRHSRRALKSRCYYLIAIRYNIRSRNRIRDPGAVVFDDLGLFGLAEMGMFIGCSCSVHLCVEERGARRE